MKANFLGERRIRKRTTCSCGHEITWFENEKKQQVGPMYGVQGTWCIYCGREIKFEEE
jgi:hypothetical protein